MNTKKKIISIVVIIVIVAVIWYVRMYSSKSTDIHYPEQTISAGDLETVANLQKQADALAGQQANTLGGEIQAMDQKVTAAKAIKQRKPPLPITSSTGQIHP